MNPTSDIGGACCAKGQEYFRIAERVLRSDDPSEEVVVYNCPTHGWRSPCSDTGAKLAPPSPNKGEAP